MKKKHALMLFYVLLITAGLSAKVQAQFYSPYLYNNNAFTNYAMASQKAKEIGQGLRTYSGSNSSNITANGNWRTNKNIVRGKSVFSSSGSYIFPKQAAAKFGRSDKEKNEIQAVFTKGIDEYSNFLRKQGYAPNDAARSASSLFIICLSEYYGKDLTLNQRQGIYQAFKSYYETNAHFQSLSDREKQEIYEGNIALWWSVAVAHMADTDGSPTQMSPKAKKTAEGIFDVFLGIPIASVKLTANGIDLN